MRPSILGASLVDSQMHPGKKNNADTRQVIIGDKIDYVDYTDYVNGTIQEARDRQLLLPVTRSLSGSGKTGLYIAQS